MRPNMSHHKTHDPKVSIAFTLEKHRMTIIPNIGGRFFFLGHLGGLDPWISKKRCYKVSALTDRYVQKKSKAKENVFRLDKNNCLVPVTYGPESRVGWSGRYFILDKNFNVASLIIYWEKWCKFRKSDITHTNKHTHTHTHTHPYL